MEEDDLLYCGICEEMSDHGKPGRPMVAVFYDTDLPAPRFPYLEFQP